MLRQLCRIIPTRVGTRITPTLAYGSMMHHPHACGDKTGRKTPGEALTESSPRVWGQACIIYTVCACVRIIPTRVGTRLKRTGKLRHKINHPHACGDKKIQAVFCSSRWQSSPRVWGQDLSNIVDFGTKRIIPTRVGTSKLTCLTMTSARDHPHACGDKFDFTCDLNQSIGSSPRVWGQA